MLKECIYDKVTLRTELIKRRGELADKPKLAGFACDSAAAIITGGKIMTYIPIGSELDCTPFIKALAARKDVTLYVPFTENGIITPKRLLRTDGLIPNRIGNLADECYGDALNLSEKLDYCITPLLGFNSSGYRIGYGKGCYDRLFSSRDCGVKLGMAFACQMVNFLPDCHDIPLDCCVTEQNVIYFRV